MCMFRSKMRALDIPKNRGRVGYKVVDRSGKGLFYYGFGVVRRAWVQASARPSPANHFGWYVFDSLKQAQGYRDTGQKVVRVLVCGRVVKGREPDSGLEGYRAEWIKRAPRPQTQRRKGRQK